MAKIIIRCDNWSLDCTADQRRMLSGTTAEYRALVRSLVGVINVHWPELAKQKSRCAALERLIHKTKANPSPRYGYFGKRFYKFPSYLRRAAVEAAFGIVSSFQARYAKWQSGQRKRRDESPPKLNANTAANPVFYDGPCISFWDHAVDIKVWNGTDWIWTTLRVTRKGRRHKTGERLSPSLIINGNRVKLSVPFKMPPVKQPATDKVCAVDLGINTTAVCSIVHSDGTVSSRLFIDRKADIDRRDKTLSRIRRKASQTMGNGGNLGKGFCASLYRRAANLNLDISRRVAKDIVDFAVANDATTVVFENLKGWRPKGGRKGSTLRQRFHGWLHRRIVNGVSMKLAELGLSVATVYARGTSSLAFDGSGPVKRDKDNRAIARFANGKVYDADLNASYNIGARYWAPRLSPAGRNASRSARGKCSSAESRMPITLSTLWHTAKGREHEAAPTAARAA